jgi:hypothetical protein
LLTANLASLSFANHRILSFSTKSCRVVALLVAEVQLNLVLLLID